MILPISLSKRLSILFSNILDGVFKIILSDLNGGITEKLFQLYKIFGAVEKVDSAETTVTVWVNI